MDAAEEQYTCERCGAEFETPAEKGGHKRGHQLKVSREELQAELQRLADIGDGPPTTTLMRTEGIYSISTVRERFGSWGEAVRSIGLVPANIHDIRPGDLKADLTAVATKLGRPPTASEQREFGDYPMSQFQNEFGRWNDALRAADFQPHAKKNISDDALLEAIHDLVEALGTAPTASEMHKHGRYSHRPYFRRWDGWQAAIRVAGYDPVGRPSGPANYKWKENPAHEWREYGDNWPQQRQKALERDGYICQTPGCDGPKRHTARRSPEGSTYITFAH